MTGRVQNGSLKRFQDLAEATKQEHIQQKLESKLQFKQLPKTMVKEPKPEKPAVEIKTPKVLPKKRFPSELNKN